VLNQVLLLLIQVLEIFPELTYFQLYQNMLLLDQLLSFFFIFLNFILSIKKIFFIGNVPIEIYTEKNNKKDKKIF